MNSIYSAEDISKC